MPDVDSLIIKKPCHFGLVSHEGFKTLRLALLTPYETTLCKYAIPPGRNSETQHIE